MNLVICGGGSGGHITPNLAVASELKRLNSNCKITYIIEANSQFRYLLDNITIIDEIISLPAGKFRRYHGDSWLKKLLDVKTNYLNLIDLAKAARGTVRTWQIFRRIKVDAVFIKGGFVGVPVGIAARLCRIQFMTHDSDARPGLTNHVIGRWASINAVGIKSLNFHYDAQKIRYTGVPISSAFVKVTSKTQEDYKAHIGIPGGKRLLLITGGSLGAQRMNEALAPVIKRLLGEDQNLFVIHQTGKNTVRGYEGYNSSRLFIKEFIETMPPYSGAADLIICRAGATQLAELATQAKPSIIVPNPQLTGGHQLDNAKAMKSNHAAEILEESKLLAKDDSDAGYSLVKNLLYDTQKLNYLSNNIAKLARPHAAESLAVLLLELADQP